MQWGFGRKWRIIEKLSAEAAVIGENLFPQNAIMTSLAQNKWRHK